jgi:hypothetical protein
LASAVFLTFLKIILNMERDMLMREIVLLKKSEYPLNDILERENRDFEQKFTKKITYKWISNDSGWASDATKFIANKLGFGTSYGGERDSPMNRQPLLERLNLESQKLNIKKYKGKKVTLVLTNPDKNWDDLRYIEVSSVEFEKIRLRDKTEDEKQRKAELYAKKREETKLNQIKIDADNKIKRKQELCIAEKKLPKGKLIQKKNDWDKMDLFKNLLLFKAPSVVENSLKNKRMKIQYFFNENNKSHVNFDFYRVKISKLPDTYDEKELLKKIRRYFENEFIDTNYAYFYPHSKMENEKWLSDSPLGAVLEIDIRSTLFGVDLFGPDNAAVVCSQFDELKWRFSTITMPHWATSNEHPVSGHREFGIKKINDDYSIFYIKGIDITSYSSIMGVNTVTEMLGYYNAIKLWLSLVEKVTNFINEKNGCARILDSYQNEIELREVKMKFKDKLESIFGKESTKI